MRDAYPSLPLCLKRLRSLAGALLLALGALGVEAQAAPKISSISPESGTATTRVTIKGKSFGSSQGGSRVTFGGLEASRYYQWSETRIQVRPAAGLVAGTHAVVVRVGNQASGGVDYTVLAKLTAFCLGPGQTIAEPEGSFEMGVHRSGPTEAALTVTVTYSGTATHGSDYRAPETLTIEAGERRASATLEVIDDAFEEGDERITYQVSADGYRPGSCRVTLEDNDTGAPAAPEISGLNPASGAVGTSVEIRGANFGESEGTSTVTFTGTEAAPSSWSETRITAPVPEGATSGNVVVTVEGVASNGVGFTVTAPAPEISGLNPASGPVGTNVEIRGTNFGGSDGTSTVEFAGTEAEPESWSETRITAPVPEGAISGNVVVTVGGVASNGVGFTVGEEEDRPMSLLCASSVSEPSGVASYVFAYVGRGNEPAADVTVTLSHSGTATHEEDYTVGTLTIPAGRTSGTMSPRLAVVDDRVFEGEERIELTATADGYQAATCTMALEDDETAPVPAIGGLNPTAGPVGTPVEITGVNFGVSEGTSTVTFAGTAAEPVSWSDSSIVAPVPEGAPSGAVVVTVGGEASAGVPFRITGVRVSPTELTIEEGGEGSYTVVLASEPASAVTVSMFAPEGTDLSVDILPVFTASNWNRPQTVTVTAGEDEDKEDDIETITHRTASADAGYHDLRVDGVEVTITDNDAGAGVRVTPTELTIEEGSEGIYTVVLNTEPSAPVTVTVTAGGDLTASPATLEFTALNWDRPQEVRVTAEEDEDASDETETLAHGVITVDSGYVGVVVDEVRVTIADDEGAGGPGVGEELTVSTTRLRITEGNMGSYTVVLNREPASGVAVAVTAPAGGDLTVDPAVLTFTAADWDRPQEVMVTAGEDADLADEVESLTHTITRSSSTSGSAVRGGGGRSAAFALASAGPAPTREYVYLGGRLVAIEAGGVVSEASVVVTIDDDDDPDTLGVPALTESLRLTEGHTGAYTLELGAAPTAPVTITLTVSRGSDNVADVTVNPTALTFTASDWDAPQWVTVSVAEDSDTVGETETITHAASSTDSRYEGIEITPVSVVIRDRNPTRTPTGTLTANPDPCTIAAGATTCSTTLTWTSTNTTAVQVRRIRLQAGSTPSINEIVVRSGSPNGDTTFSRIDLTDSPFYLYDYSDGRRGKELDTVTVHGVGALSIDPTSGPVGTVVTIMGSGFGDSQGPSTVTFGGTVVTPTSWSDTQIVFEVPQNATAGDHMVEVTVGGVERTIGTFEVTDGTPAVECTITAAPNPCTIAAGQSTCTSTLTWTSMNTTAVRVWTQQQELTPFGYVGGLLTAFTTTDSTSGNMDATIKLAPRIRHKFAVYDHSGGSRGDAEVCSVIVTGDRELSLSPTSGPVGTVVTIMGSGFGDSQGPSTVTFGGAAVTPTSWNDTRIVFDVPQNATTGTHTVVVTVGGQPITVGTFTVTTPPGPGPTITSLSPDSGVVTRWVTITGMRFGASQGASTVTFNGTPVSSGGIISWSDTVIEARVPDRATSGLVVVTVGEFVSNGVHFTVRPTITCEAWPTDIKVGASSTLSWTTVGASSLTIDDGDDQTPPITVASADVAAGSHMVTPAATTDYSLKATGPDGQAAYCTGRVTLWEAPVIEVFRADPEDINEGEATRLSWGTTHATSVEIDQGIGSVSGVDGGFVDVSPARTTPYTLTATNRAWEGSDAATAEVQVRVTPTPGGPSITCSPASSDLFRGRPETLSWTTIGASSLTIDDDDGNRIFTAGATEVAAGTHSVTPDKPTTYRLTATDQNNRSSTCPSTLTPWDAPVISLTATPNVITRGESSTLEWHVANATEVTFGYGYRDPRTGEIRYVEPRAPRYVPLSGTRVVTPGETSGYTLEATNPMYTFFNAVQSHIEVTVTSGLPPITCSISPTDIQLVQPGASATLSWQTTGNISSVSIRPDPGGGTPGTSGSRVVTPTRTTEYTFTATDPGGQSYQCSAGVTVWEAPVVSSFKADPDSIDSGAATTLDWSTRHATVVSIRPDPGGGTPGASGSRDVSPTTTTTYTLTASNPAWTDGDSTTARVPVTVSGVGDASCTLSASDSDIKPDESTTLRWTSRNADRLILNPGNIDVTGDADRSRAVTPGTVGVHPYTLSATGAGGSGACRVELTVWARPTARIGADRTTINEGQPLTLSWTSGDATRATVTGAGSVEPNENGSHVVHPLEGERSYTITASNPGWTGGDSTTASVTVTVRRRPTGEIWGDPNPCTIPAGSNSCTTTISWAAQGTTGTLVHVSHLTRAFASSGASGNSVASWIQEAPAHTYIFYLYDYMDRVQGAELDRVTVTGRRKPVIDLFEADRTTINEGQPLTLSWETTQADSVSIVPDPGGGPLGTDGSRVVHPLEGQRTYELTARNDSGQSVTARVTVTVRPKPPGTINASPNPCTIPSGSNGCTTTLSWSSTGTRGLLVRVSHNGRPSTVVSSSGATGSTSPTWIQEAPAHTYIFYLHDYMDRVQGAELDRVTVTGRRPTVTRTVDIQSNANSCQIAPGDTECSVTLSWSATNVARVRVRKGSTELANSTASSGRVDGTVTEGDNEFVAEGLDSGGAIVATDRVEVTGRPPTVQPPRIDSFTASPTSVDLGEQSRLRWTTTGEDIVATISPDVGEVAEDGSTTVTPKEDRVTTEYTLTARNSGGQDEATASVTINPPTIRNCSASPTLIDLGGSSRLSWNSSSARVSIDQGIGSVAEDGPQLVSPSTRTTYRLTATGSGGRRASCTATVKVRPRIDSFEADPSSITRGQSSTLRWTTTNASSVTLGGSGVDDDGSQVVIPYNTTRYTLTARNQDAQVSEQVTVTVTLPPAPVIHSLYPSQGVPDSPVTIYGTNFGTDRGSVSFSGSSAEINSWGTTEVSVLVPGHLSRGTVWVSLTANGQTSNSVRFEVTGDPVREECDEDEEDCPERDEEEDNEGEDGDDPPPDP